MITLGTLVVGGLAPTTAQRVYRDLVIACERFDISTPERQAAFAAQCSVESMDFMRTEEYLFYTTAARVCEVFPSKVKTLAQATKLLRRPALLANTVYAGVNGNDPDPLVGDGFRYRGRGWIQLTGKGNYKRAGEDCGQPFETEPDLVAQIPGAWLSAGAYWKRNDCSILADALQWDDITRRVNGRAMLKADLRRSRTLSFLEAFDDG